MSLGAPSRVRAWVLNLDANEELAGRTPSARAEAARARAAQAPELIELVAGGIVLGGDRDHDARGLAGLAFCPTAKALRALAAAGATPPPAPSMDVLVRANHRRLSASLGQGLDHGAFVTDLGALAEAMARLPHAEWVLKHPLGYVGRLRLRTHALDERCAAFARRCLAEAGGLQVEPWVERVSDFALHGFVDASGRATLGEPTTQVCDETGAWRATSRAHDLDSAEARALAREAGVAAAALHAIGYFGPFGVDGFRYRAPGGAERLNLRCEINARYTMGWAVGMAGRRPDLEPGAA